MLLCINSFRSRASQKDSSFGHFQKAEDNAEGLTKSSLGALLIEYSPEKRFIKPPQWLGSDKRQSASDLENAIVSSLSQSDGHDDANAGNDEKSSSSRRSHISPDRSENSISSYGKTSEGESSNPERHENAKQKQFNSWINK